MPEMHARFLQWPTAAPNPATEEDLEGMDAQVSRHNGGGGGMGCHTNVVAVERICEPVVLQDGNIFFTPLGSKLFVRLAWLAAVLHGTAA